MLCAGRIDPIPQGIDAGWASVVAHDDFGGRAAVLGMQLYREVACNPEAQSSMEILSLLGKFGGRGPMRAKPNLNEDRFAPPAKPSNGGGGSRDIPEHKTLVGNRPTHRSAFLREQEAKGGHVLAKHVAKSDHELISRLKTEKVSGASSFTDEKTAEAVINQLVDRHKADIQQWLLKSPPGASLIVRGESRQTFGRGIKLGETVVSDRSSACVVLRRLPDGTYYVHTAYPD